MTFRIVYHYLVVEKDIPKLSSSWQKKIRKAIDARLAREPELYGKPLRRSLRGYFKLRVGDYRVIYRIEANKVKIFVIQHRNVVYKTAEARN